jgi:hypothetical protein
MPNVDLRACAKCAMLKSVETTVTATCSPNQSRSRIPCVCCTLLLLSAVPSLGGWLDGHAIATGGDGSMDPLTCLVVALALVLFFSAFSLTVQRAIREANLSSLRPPSEAWQLLLCGMRHAPGWNRRVSTAPKIVGLAARTSRDSPACGQALSAHRESTDRRKPTYRSGKPAQGIVRSS